MLKNTIYQRNNEGSLGGRESIHFKKTLHNTELKERMAEGEGFEPPGP